NNGEHLLLISLDELVHVRRGLRGRRSGNRWGIVVVVQRDCNNGIVVVGKKAVSGAAPPSARGGASAGLAAAAGVDRLADAGGGGGGLLRLGAALVIGLHRLIRGQRIGQHLRLLEHRARAEQRLGDVRRVRLALEVR